MSLAKLRGKIVSFFWPEKGLPCMFLLGRRCSPQTCTGYHSEKLLNYGILDEKNNPVYGPCLRLAGTTASVHSLNLLTHKVVRELVKGTMKEAFEEVMRKL